MSSSHRTPTATLGAGAIVIHEGTVLLVQINYSQHRGSWILPGGLVELGESPDDAAKRETREETGLEVTVGELVALRHRRFNSEPRVDVYFAYRAYLVNTQDPQRGLHWDPEEMMEARFWPIEAALVDATVRPATQFYIQQALRSDRPGLSSITDAQTQTLNVDSNHHDRFWT